MDYSFLIQLTYLGLNDKIELSQKFPWEVLKDRAVVIWNKTGLWIYGMVFSQRDVKVEVNWMLWGFKTSLNQNWVKQAWPFTKQSCFYLFFVYFHFACKCLSPPGIKTLQSIPFCLSLYGTGIYNEPPVSSVMLKWTFWIIVVRLISQSALCNPQHCH